MLTKRTLKKLYGKGLSMMEIAERKHLSKSGIAYLMRKYGIKRRSRSEATYVKENPRGDPFRVKKNLSRKDLFLRGFGLGLYWGEGDKSQSQQVRLSNTDPLLIKKFREFLRKIYRVREKKIRYSLIVFNDGNKKKAVNFWAKQLRVKGKEFGKVTEIPPRGKGTYRRKSSLGVLSIWVANGKLKKIILKDIYS